MKMKFGKIFLFLLVLGFFISCEKEELPVPAHESGDLQQASANLGTNYEYQVYYDLQTNTMVSKNLKTSWDLGFECGENAYRIILNASKMMFAYDTESRDFEAVKDTAGFTSNKKWDTPTGNLNKTAIGDWRSNHHVYIIDRGFDANGKHQGFYKVQFQSVDDDFYSLRFAELNGNRDTVVNVQKDPLYNFSFLSLSTSNQVMVEPPKADWDIVFTQYTHIFYEPFFLPYLVTGCLTNRYNTFSVLDTLQTFSSIDFDYAENSILNSDINTIGYDWKSYVGGTYQIDFSKVYLIKDSDGMYYKLHFLDFYGTQGNKGEPQWEFQML